jgi:nitrogen-specific signal transduction histidine kinase/CheY-like chemotaxis protein
VWTDITERDQARAQILHTDRLAALGTLAAGTAHEINNPLTYAILNCEHVLRDLRALAAGKAQPSVEHLQEMIASLARSVDGAMQVGQVVRQLTLFACGGNLDRRAPVDVRGVVESAIQMALHQIVFRARLVRSLVQVPPVYANEASLGQVFLNLLVNAAQSIPEGRPDAHEVRVSTAVDASGRIVVEVADTGRGIDPSQLPRVFDPFFTMNAGGAASGLGLSLAHGTVSALGGQITVTSTPGVGSTFRVILPPRSAAISPGDEEGATARGQRRARMLIVDDEPLVREALGRALGRDFIVTLAGSGREALDMLSDPARGPYDVILCDLMMADVSGMDLYAETLRTAPAAGGRFVFMTGGAFSAQARAFLENVDRPCLAKPLDLPRLREIVRAWRAAGP